MIYPSDNTKTSTSSLNCPNNLFGELSTSGDGKFPQLIVFGTNPGTIIFKTNIVSLKTVHRVHQFDKLNVDVSTSENVNIRISATTTSNKMWNSKL